MPIPLKTTEASLAWQATMTAFRRVNGALGKEMLEETGVSLDTYGILLMLSQAEYGSMRPSDLADHMDLSRSATTRLVDRLEADGLVERRECAEDRRGSFVGLTTKGEETFRRTGRVHLRGIDEHVGGSLSSSELEQLQGLMSKMADGIESDALSMISPTVRR